MNISTTVNNKTIAYINIQYVLVLGSKTQYVLPYFETSSRAPCKF